MQLVSVSAISQDFSSVIRSLESVDNHVARNWDLVQKAASGDLFNFWSLNLLSNRDYAESIKEYAELPEAEKIALFKKNYPVFSWLPYVFKSYEMDLEGIPLGDGTYLPADDKDYNHLNPEWKALYREAGSRMANEVAAKMKEIALSKEEYLLIRAASLLTPDGCLSQEVYSRVGTVNTALLRTLTERRRPSSGNFLADIEDIVARLKQIAHLETTGLAQLVPNDVNLGIFLGAPGA